MKSTSPQHRLCVLDFSWCLAGSAITETASAAVYWVEGHSFRREQRNCRAKKRRGNGSWIFEAKKIWNFLPVLGVGCCARWIVVKRRRCRCWVGRERWKSYSKFWDFSSHLPVARLLLLFFLWYWTLESPLDAPFSTTNRIVDLFLHHR